MILQSVELSICKGRGKLKRNTTERQTEVPVKIEL